MVLAVVVIYTAVVTNITRSAHTPADAGDATDQSGGHFLSEQRCCGTAAHSLGSSGGDEAGRLMFAGASAGGTHILHFLTHLPCAQRTSRRVIQPETMSPSGDAGVFCGLTCVVGGTKTSVVVDSIDAGGSVLAVVVFAVVSVALASRALEAQGTLTAVMARNQCIQLVSELGGAGGFKAHLAHL